VRSAGVGEEYGSAADRRIPSPRASPSNDRTRPRRGGPALRAAIFRQAAHRAERGEGRTPADRAGRWRARPSNAVRDRPSDPHTTRSIEYDVEMMGAAPAISPTSS
jgi:hypothetical protein